MTEISDRALRRVMARIERQLPIPAVDGLHGQHTISLPSGDWTYLVGAVAALDAWRCAKMQEVPDAAPAYPIGGPSQARDEPAPAIPQSTPLDREEVARVITDLGDGFNIQLVRLVDGVSTYTAQEDGGGLLEFGSYGEAAEYIRNLQALAKADAIIALASLPSPPVKS